MAGFADYCEEQHLTVLAGMAGEMPAAVSACELGMTARWPRSS
jgi:hypothetical protein